MALSESLAVRPKTISVANDGANRTKPSSSMTLTSASSSMATCPASASSSMTLTSCSYFYKPYLSWKPVQAASRDDADRDPVIEPRAKKLALTSKNLKSRTLKPKTQQPNSLALARTLSALAESGCMEDALNLFEKMRQSNTFIWNVMIRGYTNKGLFREAIDFHRRLEFVGVRADNFTYPFVIKACAGLLLSREGPRLHGKLFKIGLDLDIYVCNSLITMYVKLGCLEWAQKVFEEMPHRDLVSWNSMISGYVSVGDYSSSFLYFREMLETGLKPDMLSMINAIGACSIAFCLRSGEEVHCKVIRSGFELDLTVQTLLVDMYSKCGRVDIAETLFNRIHQKKNVVAWNVMIGGYAVNARAFESLSFLKRMQEVDNLNPDTITIINALPSCSQLRALLEGKSIHGYAIRRGFLPHLALETAVLDMYGRCGELKFAERLFCQKTEKNLISWNSMLAAYVQNGLHREALELFRVLLREPLKPDAITIASILPAYAELASLREGKQIHSYVMKLELKLNIFISNSIVYMYAKCGDLQSARKYFDGMLYKDVVSWNVIIMAYAIHGFGRSSIQLFSKMREEGIKPNSSTFVSLLQACSTSGLVDEGWEYFASMTRDYRIDPGIEHFGCMLDLLGRLGKLEQAKSFIEEMPVAPTARIWGSLLAASRNQKNFELAELAAQHILSIDHDNTGCYVLLANMYADADRWEDVERIKCLMKKDGFAKTIGCSMVETNGKTHIFRNQDRSHAETNMIYDALSILLRQIGEDVFAHNLKKFRPLDLEQKRGKSPQNHSVRLAISFGLISTAVGEPVLVRKNTRVCEHCHNAAKRISEITKREIIVGEPKVFHHFRDGHCSCRDYW